MEAEADEGDKGLATQEVEEGTGGEVGVNGWGVKAIGVLCIAEEVTELREGSNGDEGEIGGKDGTEAGVTE